MFAFIDNFAYADNVSNAQKMLRKAQVASSQEESYEYINCARQLYEDEYDINPSRIDVLLGLSKTFQLIGDRSEAKLYVLKAYNTNPADPILQKAMGDFFYSFQEYSTAIEYYKLALASGLLRDYQTNLQTAKCFEKLGDLVNAEMYYKICNHLNTSSKIVLKKLNEYDSMHHNENNQNIEEPKYKYLFKTKKISEQEQIEKDANSLIEQINN